MSWHRLLAIVPLLVLVAWAAVVDLRRRRIPNALTLAMAATGVFQSFTHCRTVSPLEALAGIAAGAALALVIYIVGGLGGGDVKLFAGMGAWLGAATMLRLFAITAIIGAVMALVQCAMRRRLAALARNSALMAISLVHAPRTVLTGADAAAFACSAADRPLPVAVPALLALVMSPLLWRFMP